MKKFRFVALVLILSLILMPMTAIAAEKESITYTTIGDSIAFGIGGEIVSPDDCFGYVDMLRDYLMKIYGEDNVNFNDLSMASGGTTKSIKLKLSENTDAIEDADIITISIGGNDLLQAAVSLLPLLNNNPEILTTDYIENTFIPVLTSISENWMGNINDPGIYPLIRSINPTAKVYVNTVYNPFKWDEQLYGLVDPVIAGLNSQIVSGAPLAGYEVVDVYTEFKEYNNPNKVLVHDLSEMNVAIHPTTRGYKSIFNLCKDLMD